MNETIATKIREAIQYVKTTEIKLIQGAWFEFGPGNDVENLIIGCDALGAVLLHQNAIPKSLNPKDLDSLVYPQLIKAVCQTLKVDVLFLRQFWMGWDRGYQVLMEDKDGKLHADETSAWSMRLWKEINK